MAVESPCTNVCKLDDQRVCKGCGRTKMEIAEWGGMDDDQRRDVLASAMTRMNQEQGLY